MFGGAGGGGVGGGGVVVGGDVGGGGGSAGGEAGLVAEEPLTALTEEVKEEECLSEPWRSQREPVCPKTWAQSNGLYLLRHDGRRASRKQRGEKKSEGWK